MALTKVTGQVINDSTGLVVGVTTVGGGLSATDGFFSGIVTAVGDASFSGNVSVGGTLTYEDVTNIDAVGLVTARNGVVVGSGITLSKDGDGFFTGIVTATSFVGSGAELTGVASTENIRTNTNATFLQNVTVVGTSTVTGNIVPSSDSATDIGTNSVRFQNAYVDTYYGDGSNLTGIAGTANVRTGILDVAGVSTFRGNIFQTGGRIVRGSTSTIQDGDAIAGGVNITGTDMDASIVMSVFGNDSDFNRISGAKSRNATIGSHTVVNDGDTLLSLKGFGSDGTNFEEAAQIEIQVDGSPGDNDMPGRIVFKTTADGASSPTERVKIDSSGHVLPAANNTYDLGSSSLRWRDIYTYDLNLSNKGSQNDVDGTWGDYTIQEGEEDLFLINRRNGKKYKFNLTEVS